MQTAAALVAFHLGCDKGVTFLNLDLLIFFTVKLFIGRVSPDTEGLGAVTEVHSPPPSLPWQ